MFDIVKMLLENKNVAIVSDAGMPCISDPGWKMVRKIR
jgi:16S rRNA (cytidine1402-2'-O)-methyltransferase